MGEESVEVDSGRVLAPKLSMISRGSTAVNIQRAEFAASVRADPEEISQSGVARVRTDQACGVEAAALSEEGRATPPAPPPEVEVSVFIHQREDEDKGTMRGFSDGLAAVGANGRRRRELVAVEIPASRLGELAALPSVSYVEPGEALKAPTPVVEASGVAAPAEDYRRVSDGSAEHQDGAGVLVGIIDVGGFDFAHPDFLTEGGATRFEAIWDQGADEATGRPSPASRHDDRWEQFNYGCEIRACHMNRALAEEGSGVPAWRLEPQSQSSPSSHGTHVASIAAGNSGVAPAAHLAGVLVALTEEDQDRRSSFYDSARIADAVDYLIALAIDMGGIPLSINISLGTNGHAHDASSAVSRWIDYALAASGRCISVAAGNAGQAEPTAPDDMGFVMGRVHTHGRLSGAGLEHELEWTVAGNQVMDISENEMEIWYSPQDRIEVQVKPPGMGWSQSVLPGQSLSDHELDDLTRLSVFNETYHPANGANRISIFLSPFFSFDETTGETQVVGVKAGEWRVRLRGGDVRDGRYDAWIERDDPRRVGAVGHREAWRFPSFFSSRSYQDSSTVSSLACGQRIISVSNLDTTRRAINVTSSQGPTRDGRHKPEVCAPGTGIVAADGFSADQGWVAMSGTSMAAPYVTGVAALMLAVAPELTAAQIGAAIRRTARPLPGHDYTWRDDAGFGAIDALACVSEAIEFTETAGPST